MANFKSKIINLAIFWPRWYIPPHAQYLSAIADHEASLAATPVPSVCPPTSPDLVDSSDSGRSRTPPRSFPSPSPYISASPFPSRSRPVGAKWPSPRVSRRAPTDIPSSVLRRAPTDIPPPGVPTPSFHPRTILPRFAPPLRRALALRRPCSRLFAPKAPFRFPPFPLTPPPCPHRHSQRSHPPVRRS